MIQLALQGINYLTQESSKKKNPLKNLLVIDASKQSWWWNEEIQKVNKEKLVSYRDWCKCIGMTRILKSRT